MRGHSVSGLASNQTRRSVNDLLMAPGLWALGAAGSCTTDGMTDGSVWSARRRCGRSYSVWSPPVLAAIPYKQAKPSRRLDPVCRPGLPNPL